MTPQIFVTNICNKDIKKRRIWCRFWIRWKTSRKLTRRKIEGWELLYTVLKGEKIHNIYTFMLINFFNGFLINIEFCVFLYPYQNVVRKINVGSYYHFLPNLKPNARKTAKKANNLFFQTWIRINCIFQFWFQSNKVLKSFHLKLRIQNL